MPAEKSNNFPATIELNLNSLLQAAQTKFSNHKSSREKRVKSQKSQKHLKLLPLMNKLNFSPSKN